MFKKMNFKVLAIVFVALLAIVVILNLSEKKKGDRSFDKELISFNIDEATGIVIKPKAGGEEVWINKKEDGWKVGTAEESFNADETMIEGMLNDLIDMESKRLAANSEEKWNDFEVTDSTGTRVIVKAKKNVLADIFIGKFSYQQPKNQYQRQGTMTTYVRLKDKKTVHAVDGFLSMTYNRDINSFRNKYLIKSQKEDINKLTFNYADSAFTMLKQNDQWMIGGLLADSLEVDKYLGSIVVTSSQEFVDNIDVGTLGQPAYSLLVEGDNFLPVDMKVYYNLLDTANNVLLTSTYNKGTVFNGTKSDMMEKLFVGKSKFLK